MMEKKAAAISATHPCRQVNPLYFPSFSSAFSAVKNATSTLISQYLYSSNSIAQVLEAAPTVAPPCCHLGHHAPQPTTTCTSTVLAIGGFELLFSFPFYPIISCHLSQGFRLSVNFLRNPDHDQLIIVYAIDLRASCLINRNIESFKWCRFGNG